MMALSKKDEEYLAQLYAKAKRKCKDEYDINIETKIKIDMTKTLEENKVDMIKAIQKEKVMKLKNKPKQGRKRTGKDNSDEKKKKAIQERRELQKLKEQEKKAISEWKNQFNPDMIIKSPAYFEMEKYIEMVCAGYSNFCIVHSKGGLAKTWSSQAILKKKKSDYAYLGSFTTPLELYNFLYDNAEEKVILIDDCEGIWENGSIISILKNATEINGKRNISWNSTTSKLDGRANTRPFNSRIILLTNQLPNPEKNPHIQALLSRSFLCRLKLTYREKLDVIREVSKKKYQGLTEKERKNIYEFIERNTSEATEDLSIRSLIKIYHFYLFDRKIWKELGLRILMANPKKEIVRRLMNSGKTAKEQEKIYHQRTGHSRADFFRIRRELKPKRSDYPKVSQTESVAETQPQAEAVA